MLHNLYTDSDEFKDVFKAFKTWIKEMSNAILKPKRHENKAKVM